jgi:glycosyltransferase involved in cell wall biosynthesis
MVSRVGIGFSAAKLITDASLALRAAAFPARGCSVIHAVEEAVFIGIPMGRALGIPVIYDMDSILSHDAAESSLGKFPPASKFIRMAERWAVKSSSLVMTITTAMADHVRSIAPSKPIAIVPDVPLPIPEGGIDTARALAQLPSGFVDGKRVIIYAGSSAEYQGLDLLVSAMPHVLKSLPNAVLLVIGGEPSDLTSLEKRAEELEIVNNVLFMGKKAPEEIPHFLGLADVLVSPRRSGINPPAKIYTYMQSGKPVVASDIPAHTAVLNERSAVMVTANRDDIAEGILWVFAHPEDAAERAAAARDSVSGMTEESQAREILKAYEMLQKK